MKGCHDPLSALSAFSDLDVRERRVPAAGYHNRMNICPICGLDHELVKQGGVYPKKALERAVRWHVIYLRRVIPADPTQLPPAPGPRP